jgi:hypothetical protein
VGDVDAGDAFCGIPAFLDAAADGNASVDAEAGDAGSISSDAAIDATNEATDETGDGGSDARDDVSLDSVPGDASSE